MMYAVITRSVFGTGIAGGIRYLADDWTGQILIPAGKELSGCQHSLGECREDHIPKCLKDTFSFAALQA